MGSIRNFFVFLYLSSGLFEHIFLLGDLALELFVPLGEFGGFLEYILDAVADLVHFVLDVADLAFLLLEVGDDSPVVLDFLAVLAVDLLDEMEEELVLLDNLAVLLFQLFIIGLVQSLNLTL